MTRPGEQAAVEAAQLAWEQFRLPGSSRSIELLVAAAYPVIAAAVREPLEAENAALCVALRSEWEYNHAEHCSSEWPHPEGRSCWWLMPPALAARIARGTPDGQG